MARSQLFKEIQEGLQTAHRKGSLNRNQKSKIYDIFVFKTPPNYRKNARLQGFTIVLCLKPLQTIVRGVKILLNSSDQ